MEKISRICFKISAAGIIVCLVGGSMTLIGYIIGIIIGGDRAESLCTWVSDSYLPLVIKFTAVFTVIGLLGIYFSKHKELTFR